MVSTILRCTIGFVNRTVRNLAAAAGFGGSRMLLHERRSVRATKSAGGGKLELNKAYEVMVMRTSRVLTACGFEHLGSNWILINERKLSGNPSLDKPAHSEARSKLNSSSDFVDHLPRSPTIYGTVVYPLHSD